jgi:hypothetical protein
MNAFSQNSFDDEQNVDEEEHNERLKATSSIENKTVVDETITTTVKTVPSSTQNLFPYENRIIKDDQQNADLENVEASNKFIYHHLSATESLSDDVSATPSSVVRFPSNNDEDELKKKYRVRFPDEPLAKSPPKTITISWPRDNGYQSVGLMQFWQQQPLINDYKFFSRENSRAPSGNFNRNY